MDDKTWQEYQQKLRDNRKRFSRLRWQTRIWWGVYNVVADVLLFTVLLDYANYPTALALCLASTMFSTMLMHSRNKKWAALQLKQEQELMEKAPVGKIRMYE